MIDQLQALLKERETTGIQCQFTISKSTDDLIQSFADKHHLFYDIALELMIAIAASDSNIWEEGYLEKLSANWIK